MQGKAEDEGIDLLGLLRMKGQRQVG